MCREPNCGLTLGLTPFSGWVADVSLPNGLAVQFNQKMAVNGPECKCNASQTSLSSKGVGQLGINQTKHMTPREKGSALFFDAMFSSQLRNQVVRNKLQSWRSRENLECALACVAFYFSSLPCDMARTRKPNGLNNWPTVL